MVRTVLASRVSAPSPRGIPKAPGSSGSAWVSGGQFVAGHHHLDDSAPRPVPTGSRPQAPASASDRASADRAWSASPSPMRRASA